MSLTIKSVEGKPLIFTVSLCGSLDSATYADLEKKINYLIAEGGAKIITLDMAGLEFLSSMGVRVIFKAKKDLAQRNGALLMVNLPPQIKKVFEVINALGSMKIFSSIQELDAYLAKMQSQAVDE